MSSIQIFIQRDGPVTFEATDEATVNLLSRALTAALPDDYGGPTDRRLIPAHDLARILRGAGEKEWAHILEQAEEAHMVTVVVSPAK